MEQPEKKNISISIVVPVYNRPDETDALLGSIARQAENGLDYEVIIVEDASLIRIRAIVYVERESQRGILIGHRGEALKKTGTQARMDIERFFGKKAFLELVVKVDDDWRGNQRKLRRYGYLH